MCNINIKLYNGINYIFSIYNISLCLFKGFTYAAISARIGFTVDVLVFFNQRLIILTSMSVRIVNGTPLSTLPI